MRRTENTAAASVGERTAPSSKASRHVRASSQQAAALGQNQHQRGELECPRPPCIVEPHAEASPNERQAETEEDKQAWQADPAGDPGRHERGDDHERLNEQDETLFTCLHGPLRIAGRPGPVPAVNSLPDQPSRAWVAPRAKVRSRPSQVRDALAEQAAELPGVACASGEGRHADAEAMQGWAGGGARLNTPDCAPTGIPGHPLELRGS